MCIGRTTVYVRFGAIHSFRPPLEVLEHFPHRDGMDYSNNNGNNHQKNVLSALEVTKHFHKHHLFFTTRVDKIEFLIHFAHEIWRKALVSGQTTNK